MFLLCLCYVCTLPGIKQFPLCLASLDAIVIQIINIAMHFFFNIVISEALGIGFVFLFIKIWVLLVLPELEGHSIRHRGKQSLLHDVTLKLGGDWLKDGRKTPTPQKSSLTSYFSHHYC